MATYVILMNLTDQGAKAIKEAPERIQAGIKAWEKMGGKLLGFYVAMGEYDYIAIGEAPSDEVAMTFSMGLITLGNVTTKTIRAFSVDEFTAMTQKLP